MSTRAAPPGSPTRSRSSKVQEPPEVPLSRSAREKPGQKKKSARKKLPLNDEQQDESLPAATADADEPQRGAAAAAKQQGRTSKKAAPPTKLSALASPSSSSSSSAALKGAPLTPSRSATAAATADAGTPAKLALSSKKAAAASIMMPNLSPNGSAPRLVCRPEVQAMYKVVHKCTGSLGGNGSGGAIYGELTQSSMQRVINLMCTKGELDSSSVFIDVGAGLGKPNLHVAIDPAVRYSVGVEMEHVRWHLSMHNLKHYLEVPVAEPEIEKPSNVVFMHGDIIKARSFDPFTHIYMFDIGFPPNLFLHIAECLRKSSTAKYVLCYHRPQLMLTKYGFDMEFIEKQATSMHGSSEGHTAYLYRCTHGKPKKQSRAASDGDIVTKSDPLFKDVFSILSTDGGAGLSDWVALKQSENMNTSLRPRTRSQRSG